MPMIGTEYPIPDSSLGGAQGSVNGNQQYIWPSLLSYRVDTHDSNFVSSDRWTTGIRHIKSIYGNNLLYRFADG